MKAYFKFSFLVSVLSIQSLVHTNAAFKEDLLDFAKLVPKTHIEYIAARHYIVDDQFRKAIQYLRSPQFMQKWSKIRNSPELVDLIDFVQTHNVSLTAVEDVNGVIDKLPNQLRKFHIPAKVPVTMMMQRNFMSFVREVMQALPRARFASLMARKVTEGGDFARLYEAVQQKEFKQLLNKVKASHRLQSSWSELKQHHIEVNDLIDMAYELISWGP